MAEKCNIDALLSNNLVIPAPYNPMRLLYRVDPFSFKETQLVYAVTNIPQFLSPVRGFKESSIFGIKKRQCEKVKFVTFTNNDLNFAFNVSGDEMRYYNLDDVNHDDTTNKKITFYVDNPNAPLNAPPPPLPSFHPQPAADAPESAGQEEPKNQEDPENPENLAVKRLFIYKFAYYRQFINIIAKCNELLN